MSQCNAWMLWTYSSKRKAADRSAYVPYVGHGFSSHTYFNIFEEEEKMHLETATRFVAQRY
jgi:hypothetical protein